MQTFAQPQNYQSLRALALLLVVWLGACQNGWHWPPKQSACNPATHDTIGKDPRWQKLTATSDGKSWACLQTSWEDAAPHTQLVTLGKDGQVLLPIPSGSSADATPVLPDAAKDKALQFRLFVFGEALQESDASDQREALCGGGMKAKAYTCEKSALADCWFQLRFARVSAAATNDAKASAACQIQTPTSIPEAPTEPVELPKEAAHELPPPVRDGAAERNFDVLPETLVDARPETSNPGDIEPVPEPPLEQTPDVQPDAPAVLRSCPPGMSTCVLTVLGPAQLPLLGRTGNAFLPWFPRPFGAVFDHTGAFYVLDAYHHWLVRIDPTGTKARVVGGTGAVGAFKRGTNPALSTPLFDPVGLVHAGQGVLYISTGLLACILRYDPPKPPATEGTLTTLIGCRGSGDADGGPTVAKLRSPEGLAWDGVNQRLYIADRGNHKLRMYDVKTQMISTVAGDGNQGFADGPALQARFAEIKRLVLLSPTRIAISDARNHCIRLWDGTSKTITTITGPKPPTNPKAGFSKTPVSLSAALFDAPVGLTSDATGKKIYIADSRNFGLRILDEVSKKVSSLLNFDVRGYQDGKLSPRATSPVRFSIPTDLSFRPPSSVFVSDYGNQRVRKVDLAQQRVLTYAGDILDEFREGVGRNTRLPGPKAMVQVDATTMYLLLASCLVKVDLPTMTLTKLTKRCSRTYGVIASEIPLKDVNLTRPHAMAWDSVKKHLYIANGAAGCLLRVSPENPSATIKIIGGGTMFGGRVRCVGSKTGKTDGTALLSTFYQPEGLAWITRGGKSELYIADTRNHCIRKYDPDTGATSKVAGECGTSGNVDGAFSSARFFQPARMEWDGQNTIFLASVGNHCIRRLQLDTKQVSTSVGTCVKGSDSGVVSARKAQLYIPYGLFWDAASKALYFTERANHCIRKWDTVSGNVSILAGTCAIAERGHADGLPKVAKFREPSDLMLDRKGNLWIVDEKNHRVRILFQ